MKSILYDIYGGLLPEKKRLVFEYHILDDLSFQEIGEELSLTRQGCFDLYKKAEAELLDFEKKLGLASRFEKMESITDKIYKKTKDEEIKKLLDELKKLLDQKRRKA